MLIVNSRLHIHGEEWAGFWTNITSNITRVELLGTWHVASQVREMDSMGFRVSFSVGGGGG